MFILEENLEKELPTFCSTLGKKRIQLRKQGMVTEELNVNRIPWKKRDQKANRIKEEKAHRNII